MADTTPSTTPSEPTAKACCGKRTKLVVALAVLLALAAGVFWYLGANSEVNLFKFGGKGGVQSVPASTSQSVMGTSPDGVMGTTPDGAR